ncbi:MAG: S4 domain-containing protein [Gemmatimonadota bacterium]|nr:S4 domain-containing protein [Gemmatimonadota bacterium]
MAKRGREDSVDAESEAAPTRLDRWLWAARFFKTRGLASEAVAGGKVSINGARPKRSRGVELGDQIRIQLGPYEHLVTVRALSIRRGPAAEAALLFEEDIAGGRRRAEVAARLKAEAVLFTGGTGRPNKKERREIGKLRGRK